MTHPYTTDDVARLARGVGLEMPPERLPSVTATLNAIRLSLAPLDALDAQLDDTVPATTFDLGSTRR
ncbi:hypothetical protein FHR81_002191 [Actinoalloteichus hoggarensis]|uniref:Uncharacterized protein n=1 Tax=Actinoalloteichus hoggarensis TaxID=1470176 RepID=A0A221W6D7_9PSEU|nr:hypothetical protein [Actinoalloteichus hoggarensis]ASO21223.1 hypothetical protein AHOG_17990 [Actinoalloteichus hoggarensis]MBB5921153.1 hypothetical protein [Actinoalloteichus hoggarensis]